MTKICIIWCFTGCCRTAFSRTVVCWDILTCSLSLVLEMSLISILECSLITSCSPLGCWELSSWACCVIIAWSLVGYNLYTEKHKIMLINCDFNSIYIITVYESNYEAIFEWNGTKYVCLWSVWLLSFVMCNLLQMNSIYHLYYDLLIMIGFFFTIPVDS